MRNQLRSGFKAGCAVFAVLSLGAGSIVWADSPSNNPQVLAGPQVTGPATTQPSGSFTGERHNGDPIRDILASLNLTRTQRAQIKPMILDYRRQMDAFRAANLAQLQSLQAQIKTAHQSGDRDTVKTLGTQLKALMDQAPKRKDLADKIRGVLTPAQQTAFDTQVKALLAEHVHAMRHHMSMQGSTTQPSNKSMMGGSGSTTQPASDSNGGGGKLDL